MKSELECAPCMLKWYYERVAVLASEEERFRIVRSILGVISREFYPAANINSICNKLTDPIREFILASAKYYDELKLKSNKLAAELLPGVRDFIRRERTPQRSPGWSFRETFEMICCLTAASNVAPIGAPPDALQFNEMVDVMMGRSPQPFIIGDIYESAQGAANILYLADNAGEIGFDSLLIAKLKEMGSKVTLMVKEDPFFEDATMKDASFFGLDKLVDNILTVDGLFVLQEAKPPLVNAFRQSDLVVVKGTGNFQSMFGEATGKPTVYMLKVKCNPVAIKVGANIESFVVKLER